MKIRVPRSRISFRAFITHILHPRRSLQARLFLVIFIISLLPLLGAFRLLSVEVSSAMQEKEIHELSRMAHVQKLSVDQWLRRLESQPN